MIFGDPWALLILRDLMFKGARHYADFLNASEQISTNILAARLVRLEIEGILTKKSEQGSMHRHSYHLTAKGLDLVPVMLAMMNWSETWDKGTEVSQDWINNLRADPSGFAEKIIANLSNNTEDSSTNDR